MKTLTKILVSASLVVAFATSVFANVINVHSIRDAEFLQCTHVALYERKNFERIVTFTEMDDTMYSLSVKDNGKSLGHFKYDSPTNDGYMLYKNSNGDVLSIGNKETVNHIVSYDIYLVPKNPKIAISKGYCVPYINK